MDIDDLSDKSEKTMAPMSRELSKASEPKNGSKQSVKRMTMKSDFKVNLNKVKFYAEEADNSKQNGWHAS